jgi:hypothetical protein
VAERVLEAFAQLASSRAASAAGGAQNEAGEGAAGLARETGVECAMGAELAGRVRGASGFAREQVGVGKVLF